MNAISTTLLLGVLLAPARAQSGTQAESPPAAPVAAAAKPHYGLFRRAIPDLVSPEFATFDAEGRLWVTEAHTGQVRAFDGEGQEVARFVLEVKPNVLREPHGIAIAPNGEVFVADAFEQCVIVLNGEGLRLRTIGKRGAGLGDMREPRGLAIGGGKLYVADSGNHRIDVFALDGKFERALGKRGYGDGELLAPNDVAVDADGRVFVADLGNQRIARFGKDGAFGRAWGGIGPFSGLFHAPTGIAVFDGRVFVADRDNHRVQVFDGEGLPDHEWGVHAVRPREGNGKLHYPNAVAIAPKGDVVAVVEGLEGRVQLFGDEGEDASDPPIVDRSASAHYEGGCDAAADLVAMLEPAGPTVSIFDMGHETPVEITRFGRSGTRAGQFLVPADVEFSVDHRSVWVSDPLVHRISEFSLARDPGAVLRFDPYMARFARALDLAAVPGLPAAPWPPEPTALELGADGTFYVADRANARILAFDARMEFVRAFGEPGTGLGRLLEPTAIALDGSGNVYVADVRSRKVESFDAQGKPRGAWPIPNGRNGDGRPRGLAAAEGGGFWVTAEDASILVRADGDGIPVATIGKAWTAGLGRLEFFHPEGIARTPDGGLVVVDAGNHRFQVLDAKGGFRTAWGSRLFLTPTFETK